MKTITKSIAFVIATAAFTACTHQTIEPVGPSQQAQFITSRPDTLISVDYAHEESTVQPAEPVRGEATLLDELDATPKPRKPAVRPTVPAGPQSAPPPVVMPAELPLNDIN